MPAFQVGRLRCARCRGLLSAKSHFTLALMSPGESESWQVVFTNENTPNGKPPWHQMLIWLWGGMWEGVWMYGAGEVVHSKLIRWNRVWHIFWFLSKWRCHLWDCWGRGEWFEGEAGRVCTPWSWIYEMKQCLLLFSSLGSFFFHAELPFFVFWCSCTFAFDAICLCSDKFCRKFAFLHEFSTLTCLHAPRCLRS